MAGAPPVDSDIIPAMREPLRIVHVLEKNQFNTGSVNQMFQAASGQRERGDEVWVVTRDSEEMRERCAERGVTFRPLPLRRELDLTSIRGLHAIVEKSRADVIHAHKGMPHTLALAATWRRPVPAFVVNRGVSFPLTFWNRAKYRTPRVDSIVCVCENIRQVVIRSGKIDPLKVEVIYAGTDMKVFDPDRWERDDFRREKRIPPEAFVFGQVGVRDWKGWRELTDAFAAVHRQHPMTRLMLIAYKDAGQRDEILRYAAARGVGDAVIPVEYRRDMARVLAAADCVADASWAGTGITGTIREAMALGKPVIATDCGGNRELLSDPSLGWLVPARHQNALAAAMLEVLEDLEARERIAVAGMRHARRGFSSEARLDRLDELYRRIVQQKRG